MTLLERGGRFGYFYCNGKSLKCNWRATDQFIVETFKYDEFTDKVF